MDNRKAENWRKARLPADATLEQAIHNLDETALQIVLVVTPDGVLLGTITDGDIRRGLLRGLEMKHSIEEIIHRDSLVVSPEMGRDTVLGLMQANKIHQLPVVDEKRRVTGLHLWSELVLPTTRPNTMVIMAGGLGTRLRPHTETCPKPLLPVAGKPMLEHIIESARSEGFSHFVLAVHYLGHMIEEHFGNGERWGIRIDYIREDAPLGTAGALALLNPQPDIPFIVTNGDVLTDIRYGDLLEFHVSHHAAGTMAVRLHEWQHPFGVVQINGVDIVGLEEKPVSQSYINAGIYAIESTAVELLNGMGHCDMPTLFARLQEKGERILAYPMHEPWLDVGRDEDLQLAQLYKEEGSNG